MRKVLGLALVVVGCWAAAHSLAWYGDTSERADGIQGRVQPASPDAQGPLHRASASSTADLPIVRETFAEVQPVPPQPVPATPLKVFEPTRRIAVAQSSAELPRDSATLAREIQRHLKRVGCYDGEAHGVWTPTVRRAMKAFTDHVNAALPVENPDQVLLSIVESHQPRACGTPCPAGQAPDISGRCLPTMALPRDSTRQLPAPAAHSSIVEKAKESALAAPMPGNPPPLEGRMGLAGPEAPPQATETAHARRDDARRAEWERERRRQQRAAKKQHPAWAQRAFASPP